MERTYFCDGTPLDILRRRAKAMKKEDGLTYNAALNVIAKKHGCAGWEELTRRCWTKPEEDPGVIQDLHYIESAVGNDMLSIHFHKLAEVVREYPEFEDVDALYGSQITLDTTLQCESHGRVNWNTFMDLGVDANPNARVVKALSKDEFIALARALRMYESDGHIGLVLKCFYVWGLFHGDRLTNAPTGELDAWLSLSLRPHGLTPVERHILNLGDDETAPIPEDWDWKRAFPFVLDDGRYAVCNGETEPSVFRFRVIEKHDWGPIEEQIRKSFPDGPERTVRSETWLRNRLGMDEWDVMPASEWRYSG